MTPAFQIAHRHTRLAEGLELTPYRDTEGYWTIGYGHKLSPDLKVAEIKQLRWTEAEADAQFHRDLSTAHLQAQGFDWFAGLDPVRQAVVTEMVFHLGLGGFRKFKRLIWAIKKRQWAKAAAEILDSKAGREQTPKRYARLARMMREGEIPA